jgi:hypothetical protein
MPARRPELRWLAEPGPATGGEAASRITRCGAFSSPQDSSLLKLARRALLGGSLRPLDGPQRNEIDRGLGKTRPQPSNQGRRRGKKTGAASLDWWAINKQFPTPCKQTALELCLLGLLQSDHGLSAHVDPGAWAATKQFAPSHWPRPCSSTSLPVTRRPHHPCH